MEGEALTPSEAGEHESRTFEASLGYRGRFILEKKRSSDGPGGCSPEVTKFQAPRRHTSDKGNGAPTTSSARTPPPRAQDPRQACHQKHRQGRWLTHAWHSVGCSPSSALTTQKAAVIPTVQTGMPGGAQRLRTLSGQLRAAAETIPVCQTEPTVLCPHSYV